MAKRPLPRELVAQGFTTARSQSVTSVALRIGINVWQVKELNGGPGEDRTLTYGLGIQSAVLIGVENFRGLRSVSKLQTEQDQGLVRIPSVEGKFLDKTRITSQLL